MTAEKFESQWLEYRCGSVSRSQNVERQINEPAYAAFCIGANWLMSHDLAPVRRIYSMGSTVYFKANASHHGYVLDQENQVGLLEDLEAYMSMTKYRDRGMFEKHCETAGELVNAMREAADYRIMKREARR